jgi:branched-subunit amino acid transport protein AzlD
MHQRPTPNLDAERTRCDRPPTALAIVLAAAGMAALVAAWLVGTQKSAFHASLGFPPFFAASYLINYIFYLSIALGALFFVVLQHLVRAGWSVAVRRTAELLMANLAWWWWMLLFLPILVPVVAGKSPLYIWSQPNATAADELLRHKAAYLNGPFFAVRAAFYFIVWGATAWYFLRLSTRQDASRDPALTSRMERASPAAMILFAVTVTFASFDWLMSLEPHWFSTIFGVYFFAGAVVAGLAAMILLGLTLQAAGFLRQTITAEHYHDLGKLLLGFVVFWGYMAFSQYMLIWYANVPEETVWYAARQQGDWAAVTLVLLFAHLIIPFLGLLPRNAKRNKISLGFWAVWLLAAHWLDLYWLVLPTFSLQRPTFGAVDIICFAGLGCLFLAGLLRAVGGRAMIPLGDPRLGESLAFENS